MSPEILGVIVGGLIGMVSSLAGALLNHQLTLQRDKRLREEEENKSRRQELTKGLITEYRSLIENQLDRPAFWRKVWNSQTEPQEPETEPEEA